MQFSFLAFSTVLAGLVSAQSLSGLPSCANSCVVNSIPASCNLDPSCICKSTDFINGISCCIFKACDTADQQAALAYAQGICQPAGVTTLPTAAGCSAATNGTAATTSGASSTSGSASSTITSGSGSTAATSATSGTTGGSAASATSSAASKASSASASAATTNAAVGEKYLAQGMGAVGAALMGLAAML